MTLLCVLCSTGGGVQWGHAETSPMSWSDQFEIHGVLTISGDYRSRGYSKSDKEPSVQGGMLLTHSSGLYVMLWGASATTPNGGSVEADAIFGYSWRINEKNSLDFFYADVNYPGGDTSPNGETANFGEYGISYKRKDSLVKNDKFNFGVYYSPKYAFDSGEEFYVSSEYSFPIYNTVHLFGSVGYTKQDSVEDFNLGTSPDANQDDYYDYKIGVRSDFKGVTGEIAWVDNDIDSQYDMYDGRVYFSLTKYF